MVSGKGWRGWLVVTSRRGLVSRGRGGGDEGWGGEVVWVVVMEGRQEWSKPDLRELKLINVDGSRPAFAASDRGGPSKPIKKAAAAASDGCGEHRVRE